MLKVPEGDDEMRYTDINWAVYMGLGVCKKLKRDRFKIHFLTGYEVVV